MALIIYDKMKKTTSKSKQEKYSVFQKPTVIIQEYFVPQIHDLEAFGFALEGRGLGFVCLFFNIAYLSRIKLDLKCHH